MMKDAMDDLLKEYGTTLGLGEEGDSWEWFRKETGEYEEGFPTKSSAFEAAAKMLREEGADLPEVDEDGELDASWFAKREARELARTSEFGKIKRKPGL